jgi:hypothetical protein
MATSLSTSAMLDPWESLKFNERRQLLGGVREGAPNRAYDIGATALSAIAHRQGGPDDGTGSRCRGPGHEGNFAPDGLTYTGPIGAAISIRSIFPIHQPK